MKEGEKCQKNETALTSMRQMVLETSHPKVKTLSKMDVAGISLLSIGSSSLDLCNRPATQLHADKSNKTFHPGDL